MRVFLAIAMCKLSRWLLRLIGRGGTNLPGKIAVRICPDLLRHISRGMKITVITGTNGKTTSARIVEQAHIDAGLSYFANRSGANLLTGITAEFAVNASLFGKPRRTHAVIECDEAASKLVCRYIDPSVLLVTNIFRDQLDRFGEISHTLESVREGVRNSPNAVLCLNADDSLSVSLADEIPNEVVFYGLDMPLYSEPTGELSDAAYCIRCTAQYNYDYVTYSHLGAFRCPSCGYARPENAHVRVTELLDQSEDGNLIAMEIAGERIEVYINLPGDYNIYNGAGAVSVLDALGFTHEAIISALGSFECGFGRMERFELEGNSVRMILVKNPAGCNQVLNYLATIKSDSMLVICLADRTADGTDISWIWDVNFERLLDMGDRLRSVLVSGTRGDEMALRLKYAGLPPESVRVISDYGELLREMLAQDSPVTVMPTYTAMLELRDKISSAYGLRDFWE